MSLLSIFLMDESIQIEPIRRLPHIRDFVTDVFWNYENQSTHSSSQTKTQGGRWNLQDAPEGHRAHSGIPQMYRILPLPECLSCDTKPAGPGICRTAFPHSYCFIGYASSGYPQSTEGTQRRLRHWLLQHYQMLY